jgi:nicotinamidase-related amidase
MSTPLHSIKRISRDGSALVVIDVQERLVPAVADPAALVQNILRLVRGAHLLHVPVLATEQYPHGLGPTVPDVSAELRDPPFEKTAFSACGVESFLPALQAKGVVSAIVCGIEAHVCVLQTSLDLLAAGFQVFVVADAVASRAPANRHIALDRMRAAGAEIVSTEMVLFEWLGRAGTPEFKAVQALVKQAPGFS